MTRNVASTIMKHELLTVKEAASIMGATEQFVRRGLQQGVFPWGYAVRFKSSYSYWIDKALFQKAIGSEEAKGCLQDLDS